MVSRATSWMSTYVLVVISPDTTTSPVFTSVSHATRPSGSSRSTASRTPSEIWSAILSGWPSVTDSDVNRYSLSDSLLMRSGGKAPVGARKRLRVAWHPARPSACAFGGRGAAAGTPLVEVDDERHAVHAEAGAQPVLEEVGVVAGDALARVDLHREPRRGDADLRHVQHLQAVALLGRRLALLGELGEEAVELRRRDAVVHAVAEHERLVEDPADVAARQRARGQDLRAQPQLLRDAGSLVREVVLVERGDVPLVQDERGRRPLLHRELGDPQVLARDAVVRVADDERDVGALDRPLRAQRRVVLDRVLDLGLAAQAGGVDEDHPPAVDLERQVDRVAGRAGDVGDDHALGAEQAVDERRLADVRAAHDREADEVVVLLGRLLLGGQQLDDPVEEVARAEALGGRDRQRLAEAERVELGGGRDVGGGVGLVGRDDHRAAAPAAQQVGELLVARAQAAAGVDDEHRDLRVGERRLGLLADRARDRVGIEEVHAARVDEREAPAVPLARDLVAVAGDARALVHDRGPRAGQSVDERRLADVRIADDRDLHPRTRATIRPTTSSTSRPVVSTSTASSAATIGLCARVRSRSSRAATSSAGWPRRWARSSRLAVSHTFRSAPGATTVPTSRPSATQSPLASSARCLSSSAARTSGSAARREARSEISGVRIACETSSPSSSTRSPSNAMCRLAGSRSPASATARYIAPESRYAKPSARAAARATVDLPAPAGPSMATSMAMAR